MPDVADLISGIVVSPDSVLSVDCEVAGELNSSLRLLLCACEVTAGDDIDVGDCVSEPIAVELDAYSNVAECASAVETDSALVSKPVDTNAVSYTHLTLPTKRIV